MLLSGHSQYDDYGWLVSTRPVPLCVTRYELEAILRSFDCFLSCLLRRSGFCPNQSFIASYPSMNLLFLLGEEIACNEERQAKDTHRSN